MSLSPIKLDSELIVNDDGSIYHLHLREEHIAPTVLLVGDQGRVERISSHFDHIEIQIQNREFLTHTGTYNGKRLTVLSTGIGVDNIDIVVNELDAAINVDLEKRTPKPDRRSLKLIRIGTSGAMQTDIPVGSIVLARYGLGFDGLMYYYNYPTNEEEEKLNDLINQHLKWDSRLPLPYLIGADNQLVQILGDNMIYGITATASGFYGPQGRSLVFPSADHGIPDRLSSFLHDGHRITNFEMETSALYGLARMMGHQACTCCAIIANRSTGEYSEDYQKIVDNLIKDVLDKLTRS